MSIPKRLSEYLVRSALLLAGCLAAFFLAEGLLGLRSLVKYGEVGREELIKARGELRDDVLGGTGKRDENRQVLHPFFGYTYNPKDQGINNFGFYTKYNISLEESGYSIKNTVRSDLLVIGIFGGSFAGDIGSESDYIEDKLKVVFPDKKPVVMNFAVSGHALPQSALIYVYFKDLVDVVVFIDGLNEVWNYVENNKAGVPPEYAKAAHYIYKISREELTPGQFERTSQILSLKRKMDTITALSLLPVIRQSLLVHHVWKALEASWSQKVAETSLEIVKSYEGRPKFFDLDDDAILSHAAHQWSHYHRLVHDLTSKEGVLSVHLLQPNPFVPGSKVLTWGEKARVDNSYPVKPYVVNGYPRLQAEIGKLRAGGVIVEDLTRIFNSTNDSLWKDSAHVNQKGSRMIADRVVQSIRANKELVLRNRPAQYPSGMLQAAGKLGH
jgi:hypothetical protein